MKGLLNYKKCMYGAMALGGAIYTHLGKFSWVTAWDCYNLTWLQILFLFTMDLIRNSVKNLTKNSVSLSWWISHGLVQTGDKWKGKIQ